MPSVISQDEEVNVAKVRSECYEGESLGVEIEVASESTSKH